MPSLAQPEALVPIAFIGNIGHWELLLGLLVAVLLFGRRLPDVGRNVGKAIVEFKRGVKGITDEIDAESGKESGQSNGQAAAEPAKLDPPQGTQSRTAFHADASAQTPAEPGDSGPEKQPQPH